MGGNTLMVWVHGKDVGPFMNALHFFFGIGAFLSPIIVAQAVIWSGDVTYAYWALAILILPVAFWMLRQPSPSPVIEEGQQTSSAPANLTLVALICLFFFLYVSGESSMGGWVYTYATAMGLGDKVSAAYLTSGFWGALTIGRLLSIPLAARIKTSVLLWIDLAGVLVSLAVLVALPYSKVALWVGTMGTGLAMASVFPTMLALAGQRMAITGKVTGWFLVGASLGGMSTPWLIGQLFEPAGPRSAIWIISAAMVLAFGVYGLVLARASSRSV